LSLIVGPLSVFCLPRYLVADHARTVWRRSESQTKPGVQVEGSDTERKGIMPASVQALILTTACLVILLPTGVVRGQERTQLPVLASTGASASSPTKNHDFTVAQVEGAKPAPAPDVLHRRR
jgi:hypothetical protein